MSNQDFNSSDSDSGGSSNISDGLPGSDEYTETSHKSWFQKLISGVMGIVFGLVLVIGSGWFLFWNEGRSAKTIAALNEGAAQVVSVVNTRVDPANEGKLVHVSEIGRAHV